MKKILILLVISVLIVTSCSSNSPIQVNQPSPDTNSASGSEVTVPGVTIRIYAPGVNEQMNTPNQAGYVSGLGLGIWHGFIAVITLVISFFNPNVQMYEVHNTGNMYNLGFLLGLILFVVALTLLGRRRKSKS